MIPLVLVEWKVEANFKLEELQDFKYMIAFGNDLVPVEECKKVCGNILPTSRLLSLAGTGTGLGVVPRAARRGFSGGGGPGGGRQDTVIAPGSPRSPVPRAGGPARAGFACLPIFCLPDAAVSAKQKSVLATSLSRRCQVGLAGEAGGGERARPGGRDPPARAREPRGPGGGGGLRPPLAAPARKPAEGGGHQAW